MGGMLPGGGMPMGGGMQGPWGGAQQPRDPRTMGFGSPMGGPGMAPPGGMPMFPPGGMMGSAMGGPGMPPPGGMGQRPGMGVPPWQGQVSMRPSTEVGDTPLRMKPGMMQPGGFAPPQGPAQGPAQLPPGLLQIMARMGQR